MTDRITLAGIRAYGRHGANPGERDVVQPFDLDLELDVDLAAAATSDDLADTVDYATLHARVVRIVRDRSYVLLERLAAEIADAALADPRVDAVRVRIAKPRLLAGATPSVTLARARTASPRGA